MHAGRAERVRLYGIDCPEKAQPWGTRARQFTGDLAFGQTVTVRVRDIDRYGRVVGEVMLPDGRSLNRELVRAGLAWWYRQFAKHDGELERVESEAQRARRGLWSDPRAMAPWEWRRARRAPYAIR
jgi:endonuclease YncB( thermonuclease family)